MRVRREVEGAAGVVTCVLMAGSFPAESHWACATRWRRVRQVHGGARTTDPKSLVSRLWPRRGDYLMRVEVALDDRAYG